MRPLYYDLDGHEVVPGDRDSFVRLFQDNDARRVGNDVIGEVTVSTVFLALDHQWWDGPPLLFETMVFGLPDGGEPQWRYSTWEQAEEGHRKVVEAVRAGTSLWGIE